MGVFRLILGGSRRRLTIKPVTTLWFPASGLTCPNSPWFSPIFALSYLCCHRLITVSPKYKAPSGFKFIICFVSYHLPPPPQTSFPPTNAHSCGPGGFHTGLHVLSCERALPEDPASSPETISPRNFSKDLLSPSRPPPTQKHHVSLSYFLPLLLRNFITFQTKASSNFKECLRRMGSGILQL